MSRIYEIFNGSLEDLDHLLDGEGGALPPTDMMAAIQRVLHEVIRVDDELARVDKVVRDLTADRK